MFKFLTNNGFNLMRSACRIPNSTTSNIAPLMSILEKCSNLLAVPSVNNGQVRTVTKYSMLKGKRKSVRAVVDRFYRLQWGGWIRTRAGRFSKLWAKSISRRNRAREHVFCNATQSTMLDRMVSQFWRRPKYYIEDPYTPYHSRESFRITRRKPWRPEGWE